MLTDLRNSFTGGLSSSLFV